MSDHLDHDLVGRIDICNNIKDIKYLKPLIKKNLNKNYTKLLENKINNLNENNKLYLFKQVKLSPDEEFYLTNEDLNIRRCFTKIRISDHNLENERLR